jgi:hypothetical protein
MSGVRRVLAIFAVVVVGGAARGDALDHLNTKDDIGINKIPHRGTSHILVIVERIAANSLSQTRWAQMQQFYAPAGGAGTFRDFWKIVSRGAWDPIPTLVQPVLYPKCFIPGRENTSCQVTLNDIDLISTGAIKAAFENILSRIRDEQNVDLATFDVNGARGPGQDGYFDGVIVDSDIYQGVAFPLAAFGNEATVMSAPGGGGRPITCGIVAMVPPDLHEFGHTFGFVDLYGGPTVNCLMSDIHATLGAFSRQQIGWGEVRPIGGHAEIDLAPVLDGGPVLRFGAAPRYLLLENRGGAQHAALETSPPGINVYSIDEDRFPTGPFGFLDTANRSLYLPNAGPPYLDVSLPVNCALALAGEGGCVLAGAGVERDLVHASGEPTGVHLKLGATNPDGTIHLSIDAPPLPPGADTGGGCAIAPRPSPPLAFAFAFAFSLFVLRKRKTQTPTECVSAPRGGRARASRSP